MTQKMTPEEYEAAQSDKITRCVTTKVDISSLKAAYAKLRVVSAGLEAMPHSQKRSNALHDIWKALSFFDDSFTTGVLRLVGRRD